jgi:lysophospholipase L1-like esterase
MRVLVFGDSIGQGFGDPSGGWVEALKRHYLALGTEIEIFNMSVSGDTSQNVLARIENETVVRRWPNDPLMIVLAVGVNDTQKYFRDVKITADDFQTNFESMVKIARRVADKLLIVGLTPCIDDRLDPAPWNKNITFSNARIGKYEKLLEEVAERRQVPFVPLWEGLSNKWRVEDIFPDGLHPTAAGHELILHIVQPEIESLFYDQ